MFEPNGVEIRSALNTERPFDISHIALFADQGEKFRRVRQRDMEKLICPVCDGKLDLRRLGKRPMFRCVGTDFKTPCGLKFEPPHLTVDDAVRVWGERFGKE